MGGRADDSDPDPQADRNLIGQIIEGAKQTGGCNDQAEYRYFYF